MFAIIDILVYNHLDRAKIDKKEIYCISLKAAMCRFDERKEVIMGFFKDFKRDFAQAVNELMPDKDELANEYDDEDMVNTFDENDNMDIAPEDMFDDLDEFLLEPDNENDSEEYIPDAEMIEEKHEISIENLDKSSTDYEEVGDYAQIAEAENVEEHVDYQSIFDNVNEAESVKDAVLVEDIRKPEVDAAADVLFAMAAEAEESMNVKEASKQDVKQDETEFVKDVDLEDIFEETEQKESAVDETEADETKTEAETVDEEVKAEKDKEDEEKEKEEVKEENKEKEVKEKKPAPKKKTTKKQPKAEEKADSLLNVDLEKAALEAVLKREDEDKKEDKSEENFYQEEDIMAELVNESTDISMSDKGQDIDNILSDDTTYITKGTTVKGNILTDGGIDLIGTVEGDVECKGKLIIGGCVKGTVKSGEIYANAAKIEGETISDGSVKIGVGSVVIGNITAASAVIAGAVNGDIDVKGPVIVDSTAVIMGNIKSRSVQINNGAVIEGFCSQCYSEIDVKSFFE